MKRRKTEQGQAIILLTLGIITLLGFTALAIDGGRTYSEKRTIQGVADTTSLTGALYLGKLGYSVTEATKAEAVAAALERAANNGYGTDQDGVTIEVNITEDPEYYYVETNITSTVDPVIAQLVFGGDLVVAAKSVARIIKTTVFAMGQAFYAKSKTECQAFSQGGNSTLIIENNGIFSNSATTCPSGAVNIGGHAMFGGDVISAVGNINIAPGSIIPPAPNFDVGVPQQTLPTLPTPACYGPNQNDNGTTLSPGIYDGIHITNQDVFLEPGLYCLTGDLRVQGGTITGDDVMFYLMGNAGVTINGGDAYLTAPEDDAWMDGDNMYWNGMLIYQEYGNTSGLTINGNVNSYYEGTIFVPDANCNISGTEETVSQDMQMICDTIDVSGGAELRINYNDDKKYHPPMTVDLVH